MKFIAFLLATLSVVSAFAPAQTGVRSATELSALFDDIMNMDLFKDNSDVNDYGSRSKKGLKTGKLGANSYVPAGLSKAEYEKVRSKDAAKKAANYQKNVAKAGQFQDFTSFYLKRGTSEGGSWLNAAGRGHTFAKTKYDFGEGSSQETKGWKDAVGSIFGK